jgi:L-seryl-tRNA(Ser) seleniumtransferase
MAALAHGHGLILIDDLGSGALLDSAAFGLEHEPTVQESIQAGADIVCFSGDKLLGGPQGGLIVGRGDLIDRIRHHPWARAIRMDKIALAALQATLMHYLKDEAVQHVPVWQMISRTSTELKRQARRWIRGLRAVGYDVTIAEGQSTVGGGSLPGAVLPTWWVSVQVPSPDALAKALRQGRPPIIARIENDRLLLDPRTVLAEQENTLLAGLADTPR